MRLLNRDGPAGEVPAAELVGHTGRTDRLPEDGHRTTAGWGGNLLDLLLRRRLASVRVARDALERRTGRGIARASTGAQELSGSRHRLGPVDRRGRGTVGGGPAHAESFIHRTQSVS
jgi:hypothetical protein